MRLIAVPTSNDMDYFMLGIYASNRWDLNDDTLLEVRYFSKDLPNPKSLHILYPIDNKNILNWTDERKAERIFQEETVNLEEIVRPRSDVYIFMGYSSRLNKVFVVAK